MQIRIRVFVKSSFIPFTIRSILSKWLLKCVDSFPGLPQELNGNEFVFSRVFFNKKRVISHGKGIYLNDSCFTFYFSSPFNEITGRIIEGLDNHLQSLYEKSTGLNLKCIGMDFFKRKIRGYSMIYHPLSSFLIPESSTAIENHQELSFTGKIISGIEKKLFFTLTNENLPHFSLSPVVTLKSEYRGKIVETIIVRGEKYLVYYVPMKVEGPDIVHRLIINWGIGCLNWGGYGFMIPEKKLN